MAINDRGLCLCTILHTSCNPNTCKEAAARKATTLIIPPRPSAPSTIMRNKDDLMPDGDINATVEELRRSSSSGCLTCSLLYFATKDSLFSKNSEYSKIYVKVWYGSGHLELWNDYSDWIKYIFGTVFVDAEFRKYCNAFPDINTIHRHTASVNSFKRLKAWVEVCEKRHSCLESSFSILPKRVLDVGLNEIGPKKSRRLRLHESEGQIGSYIALSHCWGSSPIITTKKANIHLRRDLIQWDDLSKTFQDAVTIARRLNIPYLWIDSLCIIQDDQEDWKVQSSEMLSIYSEAYLTIAADHAKDGKEGCFASSARKPLRIGPIHLPETFQLPGKAFVDWDNNYDLHSDHSNFIKANHYLPPESNLSARGWTLQERLLSRRLIHYTSWELIWECREDLQCQCGRLSHTDKKSIKQIFHDRLHVGAKKSDLIELWKKIAKEYSNRTLTYDTDKLVALNGLAKQFQTNGLQGYIAGNWMDNIREMLLWRDRAKGFLGQRPIEYIAPSWSWASIPSTIVFVGKNNFAFSDIVEKGPKRRYLAKICSITAKADTSGQLLGGCLVVVGPTLILKLVSALLEEWKKNVSYRPSWYLAYETSSTVCTACPDYECEFEAIFQSGQKVTGLLWDVIPDRTRIQEDGPAHESRYSSHIIILQHDPEDETRYRRIGIASINWSFRGKNAPPPKKIQGMEADWGLGKDWFKNAPLKKMTIV